MWIETDCNSARFLEFRSRLEQNQISIHDLRSHSSLGYHELFALLDRELGLGDPVDNWDALKDYLADRGYWDEPYKVGNGGYALLITPDFIADHRFSDNFKGTFIDAANLAFRLSALELYCIVSIHDG